MPLKDPIAKAEYQKRYREKNREKLLKYGEDWRRNNKEYIDEYFSKPEVIEKKKEYDKEYRQEHKEEIYEQHKIYSFNNKEKINTRDRERRKIDPKYRERRNAACKNWTKKNRTQVNVQQKERYYEDYKHRRNIINSRRAERQKSDIQYVLAKNLRRRLNHFIKGENKSASAVKDLGCTLPELKEHLEKQFQLGMTWDNYGINEGQWSIDHIKALTNFDLTDKVQLQEACHYTNLQPLWHTDNIKKSNNI